MKRRHYRLAELEAAQGYAQRLRRTVTEPVRVVRGHGEVVVQVVEDERRAQHPRVPDRRAHG